MKHLYAIGLFIFTLSSFAQSKLKIYYEQHPDSIVYYFDNDHLAPYSVIFSEMPQVENISYGNSFSLQKVVPAKSKKVRAAVFKVLNKRKAWQIKKMPGYKYYVGDITTKHDDDYVYDLPFASGEGYLIYQGYNGTFSHNNQYALDFKMPVGTQILAARDGLVIEMVQNNNSGCPKIDCVHQGNFVSILHSDGTIAQYYHLKLNGGLVKEGDQVTKGQPIAISGNTGWSNGPHLHFECFLPAINERGKTTVKTVFKTEDGSKSEYLTEKKTYTKKY